MMTEDIEVTIQFTMHSIDVDKLFIHRFNDSEDFEEGYLMTLVNNIISDEGVDNFIFNEDSRYEIIDAEII